MATLHIIHVNVNGLRGRQLELQHYVQERCPDIVMLNETKLYGKPAPRIAGYTAVAVRNRQAGTTLSGGVAIYVSKTLACTDVSPDIDDMAAISIRVAGHTLAFVSYYRPPGPTVFSMTAIESLLSSHSECIVAGDFNAKHQFYGCSETNAVGEQLFTLVERNDLVVANADGNTTRYDPHFRTSELLDFFWLPGNCLER